MNQQVEAKAKCGHYWISKHQPGLPVYWIVQCELCGEINGKELEAAILTLLNEAKMIAFEDGKRSVITLKQLNKNRQGGK